MKGRLENIQHLRGIAALLVVFVHFSTPLQHFCGSVGVDLFFFISGFIIYTSIEKTAHYDQPLEFLKKRLLRVLPLYYLVTLGFLGMNLILDRVRVSELSPQYNMWEIIRSFLFIPIESNGAYKDPFVFLGWSLNFEMLFYLLTTLLISVFRKGYYFPLLSLLFLLGITGIVSGGFANVYLDFITSPFLLYFGVGLLIGRHQERLAKAVMPFAEVVFFIAGYLLFLVMLGKDYGYDHVGITREQVVFEGKTYPRYLIWGAPAMLFFLSYFSLSKKYQFQSKILNSIGNESYSIYLLQIFFIQIYFETAFLFNNAGRLALSFALIALVVWFSGISYKHFEKRFHS